MNHTGLFVVHGYVTIIYSGAGTLKGEWHDYYVVAGHSKRSLASALYAILYQTYGKLTLDLIMASSPSLPLLVPRRRIKLQISSTADARYEFVSLLLGCIAAILADCT